MIISKNIAAYISMKLQSTSQFWRQLHAALVTGIKEAVNNGLSCLERSTELQSYAVRMEHAPVEQSPNSSHHGQHS